MRRLITTEFISSLLILLFAYTGISKLYDYQQFSNVLSKSPLLSRGAGLLAWLIPLTELCIVLLLLFTHTRKTALYLSLALLSLFTGYLIYMVTTSSKLPCSCGGVVSSLGWKEHILFNCFFLSLTGFAIRHSLTGNRSIHSSTSR